MADPSEYFHWMDRYQTFVVMEKGLSRKTVAAYSTDLMRFGRFLEERQCPALSKINPQLILVYPCNNRWFMFSQSLFTFLNRNFFGVKCYNCSREVLFGKCSTSYLRYILFHLDLNCIRKAL